MNFYQSQLRKYITKEIYQKPTFEVDILGKTYQGVMKQQKRFGKQMRRYMVHGVELDSYDEYSSKLKDIMLHLERDYKKDRWDMFFQIGLVDELWRYPTDQVKDDTVTKDAIKKRKYLQSDLRQRYKLKPSRREHMPDTTIVLDVETAKAVSSLSSSGKRYVNKGKKAWLTFQQRTKKADREAYRAMRYAMAYDKRFNVIPQETFLDLMNYLKNEKKGALFTAEQDGEIVSGAVYLYYGKQLVYLYGATDRSFGSIGAQYRLTHEIVKRWADNVYTSLDLLGVAPVGWEEWHQLEGVTRFKQAFGGETISYVGNYDLIFNSVAYKGFKLVRGK